MAFWLISAHQDRLGACEAYLLLVHGGDDSDKEIFTVIESRSDLRAKITLWNLNVILRDAIHGHQVKETVVDVDLGSVRFSMRCQYYCFLKKGGRQLTSWYSVRRTFGTSMLWVEGQISSYGAKIRPPYKV
jgi:hypothetical protein